MAYTKQTASQTKALGKAGKDIKASTRNGPEKRVRMPKTPKKGKK
jgi:hypothetical protein